MRRVTMIQAFLPMILVVLSFTSFSTSALTTFGKTNPQTQNQPQPPPTPVGNARDCKMDSDCNAIQNTTCMPDRPRDGKTRCLCGDYSAPINGRCNNKGKGVHVPCNDDSECHEGSECVEKDNSSAGKKCVCKEGYYEENFKCNGAERSFKTSTIGLVTVALLLTKFSDFST